MMDYILCVCVCVCMIQEDERKKREKEERMAREEEFLRSSLRGSRKLQALEKSPPTTLRPSVTGVVNIAYSTGEEEVEDTAAAAGGPVAAEDRTLGRLEDPGHKESALSSAGLALALARSNYLINAGSMQKVVGNSFIFSIIFLHLLYFLLHRVGFCLGIGLGFVSGIGLD